MAIPKRGTSKDKLQEISERLEKGIENVFTSDRYRNYLKVMSKFYNYSYRNSMLILLQNPEATRVAGYKAWNTHFKRQVNKGEKGLQILAPTPYTIKKEVDRIDETTNQLQVDQNGKILKKIIEVRVPRFRPVYVFDISQTSGEPLPTLTDELTGNVHNYSLIKQGLQEISPFPIRYENILNGAKGYCNPSEEVIAIQKDMSQEQTIKTAIHEITHADLHAPEQILSMAQRTDRRTREVEAESVAYILCTYLNMDTASYSFSYIASWSQSKDLEVLKGSLDRIQKQSFDLLYRLEKNVKEHIRDNPEVDFDFLKYVQEMDLNRTKDEPVKSIKDRLEAAKSISQKSRVNSKKIEREER